MTLTTSRRHAGLHVKNCASAIFGQNILNLFFGGFDQHVAHDMRMQKKSVPFHFASIIVQTHRKSLLSDNSPE